ncbi:MAG: site-2 protease family protein [Fimbriimonadaceae bacterium]|nr:site-2 protease family protein [Fimbriimonadaceae bacterium]
MTIFLAIVVLVIAITIHEFAHAWFADLAGDPTPRIMGRVTLNPIVHLDPIGSIFMVISMLSGVGIGWGKPVMVNPSKMRNPRWDHFVSVAAGPISNVFQAFIYALIFRFTSTFGADLPTPEPFSPSGALADFLYLGVLLNVAMTVFNLIPLGPLDGHWLIGAFLPEPARLQWYRFNQSFGTFILLALVLIPSGSSYDVLGMVMGPALNWGSQLLLGTR